MLHSNCLYSLVNTQMAYSYGASDELPTWVPEVENTITKGSCRTPPESSTSSVLRSIAGGQDYSPFAWQILLLSPHPMFLLFDTHPIHHLLVHTPANQVTKSINQSINLSNTTKQSISHFINEMYQFPLSVFCKASDVINNKFISQRWETFRRSFFTVVCVFRPTRTILRMRAHAQSHKKGLLCLLPPASQ